MTTDKFDFVAMLVEQHDVTQVDVGKLGRRFRRLILHHCAVFGVWVFVSHR
jgi:hypothetical protein